MEYLAGGGELGRLIRARDWSKSPLGAPARWPQSLRHAVRLMLDSHLPMQIWWGSELILLYNDAFAAAGLEDRHPWALGRSARSVHADIWEICAPRVLYVQERGQAASDENHLAFRSHKLGREAIYQSFSYAPLREADGRVAGLVVTAVDNTRHIIAERQHTLLRRLSEGLAGASTVAQAFERGAAALVTNSHDLPFAALYRVAEPSHQLLLAATANITRGHRTVPERVDLDGNSPWTLDDVVRLRGPAFLRNLELLGPGLPTGGWDIPPHEAVALPIPAAGDQAPFALLVVGLSPYRPFDDGYSAFLGLVASQLASGLANALAREAEDSRAAAVAQLEAARHTFFANVSHEFRTPLTMLLGLLAEERARVPEDDERRERLETMERNGRRLLKLVNTLLEFSRMEAGQDDARFEPVDLPRLTAEIVESFRPACEAAGIGLAVDCPALPAEIFVDRDLYERVVLNLLSNALKHTFRGSIAVTLRWRGDGADLTVSDSGVGIPERELPRIFDRFYRVRGTQGRTTEGAGLGLAIVRETMLRHGGDVRVQSAEGVGSTFTVSIPAGTAHLPAESIVAHQSEAGPGRRAVGYLEEAMRWLPQSPGHAAEPEASPALELHPERDAPAAGRPRILWADSNADLRSYVRRLLGPAYDVLCAADGHEALSLLETMVPDLVLTDVALSRLGALELLRQMRADPRTHAVPAILVSSQTGEDAVAECRQAGADDYLTKPFTARELMARVEGVLSQAKLRRDSDRRVLEILEAAELFTWEADVATGRLTYSRNVARVTGFDMPGDVMQAGALLHEEDRPAFVATFLRAVDGAPYDRELRLLHPLTRDLVWLRVQGRRVVGADGSKRLVGVAHNITDRRAAELALHESENRYRNLADATPMLIWATDLEGRLEFGNDALCEFFAAQPGAVSRIDWMSRLHPESGPPYLAAFRQACALQAPFQGRVRVQRADGEWRWLETRARPRMDHNGTIVGMLGCSPDITELVESEHALQEADRRKDEFLATLAHELRNPLAPICNSLELLREPDTSGPVAAELNRIMERQARMLVRLVDDLLEVSRITHGAIQLRQTVLDMADVCRDAVEMTRPAIEADRHRLDVVLPSRPLYVWGDSARLTQVVANLLGNAAKYTDAGGHIVLTLEARGGDVAVSVRDNGIGIPPDHIHTMFNFFTRGATPPAKAPSGLGIGLALARNLVTLHGGTIEGFSDGRGTGSEFTIRLPRVRRDHQAAPASPRREGALR